MPLRKERFDPTLHAIYGHVLQELRPAPSATLDIIHEEWIRVTFERGRKHKSTHCEPGTVNSAHKFFHSRFLSASNAPIGAV